LILTNPTPSNKFQLAALLHTGQTQWPAGTKGGLRKSRKNKQKNNQKKQNNNTNTMNITPALSAAGVSLEELQQQQQNTFEWKKKKSVTTTKESKTQNETRTVKLFVGNSKSYNTFAGTKPLLPSEPSASNTFRSVASFSSRDKKTWSPSELATSTPIAKLAQVAAL